MSDKKETINSILLVNWYLVNLQLDKNSCSNRTELTKNYLTCKISKALTPANNITSQKVKVFSFLRNYI